ncbi:DUF3800 domain-containing protein [Sphingomonas sp. ERG5]|uniref:DUF3800 domain-containing protein n=1 Tax=Sphingomonas sp. ERG5 TaxID=1381597 RepID=UPI00054B2CAD|nr:DUF3800 domain-containing protein [Sphingomonas sp. ERG5]
MRFYLDESGSTGDVAKVGAHLDFGDQPIFVLAAIGVRDGVALAAELRRLADLHGVVGAELRSTNLVKKPEVAGGIADYLLATDSPLFIEMMDKRFLMIINLMNYLVLPPVRGFDEMGKALIMRKVIVELMAGSLPDIVLIAYAKACETELPADLEAVYPALRKWAREPERGEFRDLLIEMIDDSLADVVGTQEPDGHLRFLPAPDRSVTGRSISILPGLSALTNIYARINKYRRGHLADVTLVHDEHMLFGEILTEAKKMMERLSSEEAVPILPNADYRLREHASLAFASSSEPGVQAADVLAGFVMRFFRDAATGRRPSAEAGTTMQNVMELTHQPEARGINLVAADTLLRKAGFH